MINDTSCTDGQTTNRESVLSRSSDEWCVVQFVVGSFIGAVLIYAWVDADISIPPQGRGETEVFKRLASITGILTVFHCINTYQWVRPKRYVTTVSASSITFSITSNSAPPKVVHTIYRQEVMSIELEDPRGRKRGYLTYRFELAGGSRYLIDHRFVWAGNHTEFAQAVLIHWGLVLGVRHVPSVL